MKRSLALLALLAIALSSFAASIPFSFWKTTGAAAPSFVDPSSISGLKLWLKADALALSDGAAVSSWTDSSGLGNNATQATGANQPIFKTAILNSLPVVRFDGVNDTLTVASLNRGAFTAFYVYKTSSASTMLGEQSATINSNNGFYFIPSGAAHFGVTGSGGQSTWDASGLTLNDGVFRSIAQRFSGTHASHSAWTNGGAIAKGTLYSSADPGSGSVTDAYYIAARGGSSRFLAGDLAEIIVYNSALSEANRLNVTQFLANKYALNNYALLFNGSSQYVTVPNTPVNPNANFTIEAWIKVGTAANSNVIFSGSSGANYWMLDNRSDANGLCWQVDEGGGSATFVGASSANVAVADGWTHVAVTRSGSTFSFYKNGTLLKTGTWSNTGSATANQQIAKLPIGSNFFNGRIDEVRTWSVARTATEINNNKSVPIAANTPGLTGYWRFEGGTGSAAEDYQSNGTANDGTLVGSPTWSTDKPF